MRLTKDSHIFRFECSKIITSTLRYFNMEYIQVHEHASLPPQHTHTRTFIFKQT